MLVVTFSSAIGDRGLFAGVFRDVYFFGGAAAVAVAGFQLYVIWRVRKKDERFALVTDLGVILGALFGTRFDGADLTDADLAGAQLTGVNFGKANLTRVNWRGAGGLDESLYPSSILEQPAVRELLTTGQGHGRSFMRLDLHGANLAGAALSGANLKETNCAGANFAGAELTGACIESWNIDATTVLQGVTCAEVFLVDRPDRNTPFSKRRPADANRDFAAGEFEQVYRKILNEMEILFEGGLSPKAMGEAFDEFHAQHPEASVRKVEFRDNDVVVGVVYPAGTDEGSIERALRRSVETQLMIAAEKIKLLESHNQDMKEVALSRAKTGDQFVQDKSIRGNTISNSQVTTGDGNSIVQSLQQSGTGGGGVAELASVLQQLLEKISAASDLGAMEKHEAKQAVETVGGGGQSAWRRTVSQGCGQDAGDADGVAGQGAGSYQAGGGCLQGLGDCAEDGGGLRSGYLANALATQSLTLFQSRSLRWPMIVNSER